MANLIESHHLDQPTPAAYASVMKDIRSLQDKLGNEMQTNDALIASNVELKEKLADAKSKIKKLAHELNFAQMDVSKGVAAVTKVSDLEIQLSQCIQEKNLAVQSLETIVKKMKELGIDVEDTTTIDNIVADRSNFQNKIDDLQKELKSMEAKCNEYETLVQSLIFKNKEVEDKLENADTENREANQEISSLKTMLEEKEQRHLQETKKGEKSIEILEAQLKQVTEELNLVRKEKDVLAISTTKAESQVAVLQHNLQLLKKEKETTNMQLEQKAKEVVSMRNERDNTVSALNALKSSMHKLQTNWDAKETSYKQNIEQLNGTVKNISTHKERLEQQLQETSKQLRIKTNTSNRMCDDRDRQLATVTDKMYNLFSEKSDLETELQCIRYERDDLLSKEKQLQESLSGLESLTNDLRAEITVLEAEKNELVLNMNALEDQYQTDIQLKEFEMKSFKQNVEENFQNKVNGYKESLQQLENQKKTLEKLLESSVNENKVLATTLEATSAELETMRLSDFEVL